MRDANEKMQTQGKLVRDKNDRVVPNPYVIVAEKATQQMTEIGRILGLVKSASAWDAVAELLLLEDNYLEEAGDAGDTPDTCSTCHAEQTGS
jgi:phage terminase small subunit